MPLKDMARRLPEEIWVLFEPILPARIGCGNGRPLKSHRDGFDALRYVWVVGMPWELLPVGFPSHKSIQRRLTVWLALEVFHPAGGSGPNGTHCCTGSTGIKSCSTAPRNRPKKGRTNRAFPGGPSQRDCLAARGRRSGHALGSRRDLSPCHRRWPHPGAARRVGRAAAGSGPTPGRT